MRRDKTYREGPLPLWTPQSPINEAVQKPFRGPVGPVYTTTWNGAGQAKPLLALLLRLSKEWAPPRWTRRSARGPWSGSPEEPLPYSAAARRIVQDRFARFRAGGFPSSGFPAALRLTLHPEPSREVHLGALVFSVNPGEAPSDLGVRSYEPDGGAPNACGRSGSNAERVSSRSTLSGRGGAGRGRFVPGADGGKASKPSPALDHRSEESSGF